MIILECIAVVLSIAGYFLVVKKLRAGFVLWILANSFWIIVFAVSGLYSAVALFIFYTVLAAWGVVLWRPENSKGESLEEYYQRIYGRSLSED